MLGALATFRSAEVSSVLTRQCPVLASTLHHVANLRVRNVATWGGNLAEADSTSDLPAVLVALDSEVVVRSATGQRVSTAADLLVDFFATTLEPDEMIVEVRIPAIPPWLAGSYVKFVSRSGDDRTCLGVAAFHRVRRRGPVPGTEGRRDRGGARSAPAAEVEARVVGQVLDESAVAGVAAAYAGPRTRCRTCAAAPVPEAGPARAGHRRHHPRAARGRTRR